MGFSPFDTGTNQNRITRNAIFQNGALGIDLGGDGPTLNDPSDFDPGPNQRQNFPAPGLGVSLGRRRNDRGAAR